jgi:hypothetical protein
MVSAPHTRSVQMKVLLGLLVSRLSADIIPGLDPQLTSAILADNCTL